MRADRTHKTGSCVRACEWRLAAAQHPEGARTRTHTQTSARAHYASKSAATVRFDARTRRYADGRGFALPHQLARSRAERVAHLVEDCLGLCGKERNVSHGVCCAACCILHVVCIAACLLVGLLCGGAALQVACERRTKERAKPDQHSRWMGGRVEWAELSL